MQSNREANQISNGSRPSHTRPKKYRVCDSYDLRYSSLYCPKHGFKSIDSQLDKFRRFENLEQYLNERLRTTDLSGDQYGSDVSDDNYEDIDENDLEYEMELNSQYNRYNDQHLNQSHSSPNKGFTSKLFDFFIQFWYCLSVSQSYKEQMKRRRVRGQGLTAANSVSMIDKTSRILFPFVFFILNFIYWAFLIHERNSEFKLWTQVS